MYILKRVANNFVVERYDKLGEGLKLKLMRSILYKNGLGAVEELIRGGMTEECVSAAYTAMMRRGFTKAYFSHRGELLYLGGGYGQVLTRGIR